MNGYEQPLDYELELEVELFPDKKESIVRTVKVPIYRFSPEGRGK